MPKVTQAELRNIQLKGLQWTIKHAYRGSNFYRNRLHQAGIGPDTIRDLGDLQRLPFTTARDLQEGYPFPLRSVPFEKVVRIHGSSGTTGKRKIMCYTQKDINDWVTFFARLYEMIGVTRLDRVQISSGYGLWTAGFGFQAGCERLGAMAIPLGPGNIDLQCQFLEDFQTTVLMCTASMGLLMAEEVAKRGLKERINLRLITIGSERSSDAMRERIKDLLGIQDLFDVAGMTELYGPGTGVDCAHHTGIHYWADYYILEILDPQTLKPVREGEIGEMVITTLRKEGAPLIRYRTRDLTRLMPGECPCGSVMPRHDRLLGRSDDMIIFRAVNIYPGQIDHVLSGMEGIGSEYQILLDHRTDGKDYMTVRVERGIGTERGDDGRLSTLIRDEIKKQVIVSADVQIVDYAALPRSDRKSKRVFDNRKV